MTHTDALEAAHRLRRPHLYHENADLSEVQQRQADFERFCADIAAFQKAQAAAPLPADAAREKVAAWMIGQSIATGHGDTLEDLLGELSAHFDRQASALALKDGEIARLGKQITYLADKATDLALELGTLKAALPTAAPPQPAEDTAQGAERKET